MKNIDLSSAEKIDIRTLQNDSIDYSEEWFNEDGSPFDFTGYTARLQVRRKVDDTDVVYEWSTATGEITFNSNTLSYFVLDTEMSIAGDFFYALKFTNSGNVPRVVRYGKFKVVDISMD